SRPQWRAGAETEPARADHSAAGSEDAFLRSALAKSMLPPSLVRVEYFGRVILRRLAVALTLLVLSSGCSFTPLINKKLSGNRAFIDYWPADPNSNRLRLAVKDNIDMQGVITTAGSQFFLQTNKPAQADAQCLAIARQRNVQIVGKTNLTEFAVSPSGVNEYFGTPENPLRHGLIPGGSSSGSAVAVASGMADVAFGTDSAGSIRVPAACCGIVGLKTTHGLISIEGLYPIEPEHLDTVGPMGKDIASTVVGMDLLQRGFLSKYSAEKAAHPAARTIRIGRLRLKGTDPKIDAAIDQALSRAGFRVIPLDASLAEKWERAKTDGNSVAAAGAWISDKKFQYTPGVALRTKVVILTGRLSYLTKYTVEITRRAGWPAAPQE